MRLTVALVIVLAAACRFDTSSGDGPASIDGSSPAVDAASTDGALPDVAVGPDSNLVTDAAHADAHAPDAALPDAALPDAALPDAALPDAALPDAALPDAALPDAALPDAATDVNTALLFDGVNDYVRVKRQVQNDFTIEAWIRTTSTRGGSHHYNGLPILHADVAGGGNDFGTAVLNGRYAFGTGNPDVTIVSTTTVTTGQWIHVAATREQATGTIRVYINGVQEAEASTTTAELSAPDFIDIGGNNINNRFFSGTLDEIRIWDFPRSAQQLQANMSARLTGNEPGLVNYWRLDDRVGFTANDSAGSNHGSLGNGELSRAPTWVSPGAPGL